MSNEKVAEAISAAFRSTEERGSTIEVNNVVGGLMYIGQGLLAVAKSLDRLGLANANTDQGAIKVLAEEIKDGFAKLASAKPDFSEVAAAIREGLDNLEGGISSGLKGKR